MNRKGLRLAAATFLCLGMLSQPAFAQVAGDVNIAPPPLRAEVIPPGPNGSIWIPGYWYWDKDHYKWIDGVWAEAKPGYVWIPARWEERAGYHHFVAGYWQPLPAQTTTTVVVTPPPPPPMPHEEVVVEVRPGYVWMPGYWNWDGYQYIWFAGAWRPEHGPHHWEGGPHGDPHWGGPGPHWR